MGKFIPVAIVMLLSTLALATGDTVNERIPVDNAAMESHWEVDCAGTWARFMGRATAQERPGAASELHRELRLCAFIYQPPGGDSGHRSPDYQRAVEQLERAVPPAE